MSSALERQRMGAGRGTADPEREEEQADDSDLVRAIPAEQVRVWEDHLHMFHVRVDDQTFDDVRAVGLFPVSGMAGYVSFMDETGKEVVLLKDPENLDETSREALEKALDRMYYVAQILRVLRITENHGISRWETLTDRGFAVFEVLNRETIREPSPGRYLITDADGNRFEIRDVAELDAQSRAFVASET
ncbi:MAG: DUF1854 domain-containing protein [Candidatus Sumerlaeota bacterium]|nr:DUF1854 domain-containing protein [Candidatus Sumerlaeota bacterium]